MDDNNQFRNVEGDQACLNAELAYCHRRLQELLEDSQRLQKRALALVERGGVVNIGLMKAVRENNLSDKRLLDKYPHLKKPE